MRLIPCLWNISYYINNQNIFWWFTIKIMHQYYNVYNADYATWFYSESFISRIFLKHKKWMDQMDSCFSFSAKTTHDSLIHIHGVQLLKICKPVLVVMLTVTNGMKDIYLPVTVFLYIYSIENGQLIRLDSHHRISLKESRADVEPIGVQYILQSWLLCCSLLFLFRKL